MTNELNSTVYESGNSDVDVNIQIEMTSIAYMYACSLFATDQIDEEQFDRMIKKYRDLMKSHHHHHTAPLSENHRSPVKLLGPVQRLTR